MINLVKHPNFGTVRTEVKKGEPWFVGKDVCEILGISNHNDALGRLDDDERRGSAIPTPLGGTQETVMINESGLYSLIFQSRKPFAKQFRKWVTKEVLPAIRRDGFYIHPDFMDKRAYTALKKSASSEVSRYLTEEDTKKICKRFGVSWFHVKSVINGTSVDNAIMQDAQKYALTNKSREINAYHPERLQEVINKLRG